MLEDRRNDHVGLTSQQQVGAGQSPSDPLEPSSDPITSRAANETLGKIATGQWHAWPRWQGRWQRYPQSVLLVAAATLVNEPLSRTIAPTNLAMSYLVIVVIAAIYLGRDPAILAAALSVLSFDFFFVPPYFTLAVSDTEYLLTFLGLFIVGLVISTLAARAREQADAAAKREAQTAALYAFSQGLAVAASLEQIVDTIVLHTRHNLGRGAAVLLPRGGSLEAVQANASIGTKLSSNGAAPHSLSIEPIPVLAENDRAAATWVFQRGQPAGQGLDALPASVRAYFPLKTARAVVGVLAIEPAESRAPLTSEQRRLIEIFASQAALAIERNQLGERARQAELSQAKEKLQMALLDSVSHDLRTPLVSITGALSSLAEEKLDLDEQTRQSLIETAYGEARRLNWLVRNLLDMTRIDSGAMIVRREPCEILDLIGSALEQMGDRLADRPVNLDIAPDLPLVPLDFVLVVQVLVNLLDNAAKYSPNGTPIDLQAVAVGDNLEILVADCGPGIPIEDLERVFDKFYRVERHGRVGGTGLGLSICKGIVEAHDGRIQAENRSGGGTVVRVVLPMNPPTSNQRPGRHNTGG